MDMGRQASDADRLPSPAGPEPIVCHAYFTSAIPFRAVVAAIAKYAFPPRGTSGWPDDCGVSAYPVIISASNLPATFLEPFWKLL